MRNVNNITKSIFMFPILPSRYKLRDQRWILQECICNNNIRNKNHAQECTQSKTNHFAMFSTTSNDFNSKQNITISLVALAAYDKYLSNCLKALCSIMHQGKTRAKWAVRSFTACLALVCFRGIRVAFGLLKSTPQIVGHLVYMI